MKTTYDIYGDGIGSVQYIRHMGTDATIVQAARVSFGKDLDQEALAETDHGLLRYLVEKKHTSTLEHNLVTFKFTVPLFIRSQHHRHRTWSYNEISRRYTDENIQFYEPSSFRTQHKSNKQASNLDEIDPTIPYVWGPYEELLDNAIDGPLVFGSASLVIKEHHENCLLLYEALLKEGVCREQARGVLPQNMYTEYYGTVNLNNLFKFVGLRLDPHAQWEIQVVGQACLDIAEELWPVTVAAYREINGFTIS
jgi:thymidylate synthase (FAD)